MNNLEEANVPAVDQVNEAPQWGGKAPKGARAVFARIIKEGANVPLFLGQTLINALRDLGYNDTTSAVCEHVDNSLQWGARDVRIYFHEKGRRGAHKVDVLVYDNGSGMPPNVLKAVTAFGGSMAFDNRERISKYGMGMKAAALSMATSLEIYSWQEPGAIYRMILDVEAISMERGNVVQLPDPELVTVIPTEIRDILTSPMSFPRNTNEQDLLARPGDDLTERLGPSGTIIYVPDCDRLTHRTPRTLAEQATREMARIYRRALAGGQSIYVNNRRLDPFDPTYQMEAARHFNVEGLTEKRSRQVRKLTVPIPIEEGSPTTKDITVKLFLLPIEDWDRLPLKVKRNDLRVFDYTGISFMRNDREVYMGPLASITGKMGTRDSWWRIEIDFTGDVDEGMGVAVNKQGVRPKGYVTEAIRKAIKDELSNVRNKIEEHWSRRAVDASKAKLSEAEQRATDAEALQATLLPAPAARTPDEVAALEKELDALADALKRDGETEEEARKRIRSSKYITTFDHNEDLPFYRVEYKVGKVILRINSAHPFFDALYRPLARIAKGATDTASGGGEEADIAVDADLAKSCGEALVTLELFLLTLARTQSEMTVADVGGDRQRAFDQLRRQWSLNFATVLRMA